jgi:hypothetical protein
LSTLSFSSTDQKPTFTPDVVGDYIFDLTVTDSLSLASTTYDSVTITANPPANQAPSANAGPDQSVTVLNTVVILDGSGSSDPEPNLPLTYEWILFSKPASSSAFLSDSTAEKPTFTADLEGDYVFHLTVTDGLGLPSTTDGVVTISVYVNDDPIPTPEFPSMALPAAFIVGLIGAVLFIKSSKED